MTHISPNRCAFPNCRNARATVEGREADLCHACCARFVAGHPKLIDQWLAGHDPVEIKAKIEERQERGRKKFNPYGFKGGRYPKEAKL